MSINGEKIVFGIMGGMVAIILGLAVYHDFEKMNPRTPASQQDQFEYTPYPYFFD